MTATLTTARRQAPGSVHQPGQGAVGGRVLTELADGIEDPRPAVPEFVRFLEQLKGWVDGPPAIERLDVVGSYNLFETRR